MDLVLGQRMKPKINLKQFLDEYKKELKVEKIPQTEADIQTALGFETDEFKALQSLCSLDHATSDNDNKVHISEFVPGYTENARKFETSPPNNSLQLNTFHNLIKWKETSMINPFKRSRVSFKMLKIPTDGTTSDMKCNFYDDLIVTVRVYRPTRATHIGQTLEKPVFSQEFLCLGSNYLTALRDKISCICNKKRFFDVSEDPSAKIPGKELDPGYFFITNTFYNDTRIPNNPDYSETICKWAKTAKGLKELKFGRAKMETTRFLDLEVSLGFPQLYQHHGNCEHVFVFSQLELFTSNAPSLTKQNYPLLTTYNVYNNRLCHMCGKRGYNFIVEQSKRQLYDPAYICSKCFYSFHYIDGKKVGNFLAYRVSDHADMTESTLDEDEINTDEEMAEFTLDVEDDGAISIKVKHEK